MSNSSPAVLSTDVVSLPAAAVVEVPAVNVQKAYNLTLTGPSRKVFAEAAVHIRNGYRFAPNMSPELLAPFFTAVVYLELGQPEEDEIKAAVVSNAEALDIQRAAFDKQVQAEAQKLVAEQERVKKQEALAAEIAASRAALAKLVKAAAAV